MQFNGNELLLILPVCVLLTVRIRATINVTSLTYDPQLDDLSSRDFAVLARGLKEAIESEYMTVPGQQTVDVLQFRYTYRNNYLCKNVVLRDRPKFGFGSVTAPKLAIFLVSVTAVIVKHGFGLLSVTAETTTRFRREPKLSLLAIR